MAEVTVHIDELVLPDGPPEPGAIAPALAGPLGDRLAPDQLAAVGIAVEEAVSGAARTGAART